MPSELQEIDTAGNVVKSYVVSEKRLDVVKSQSRAISIESLWQSTLAVFLPVGYPNSVTPDYMKYQIYDSLQAFSSSIAGLLSSRAVLEGVGVGDASASPTAAIILSIIQDSTGRVATILFAHRLGTALEPECKMWRLAADVFNDAAMILDCLSPALPKTPRVLLLSTSSVLRALCGVAAGSSKASLSAHFAKWGNLGELNAKDSSQETVISLMGMLAGSFVVGYITSPMATWSCLILLLSIHLAMNHAAVRAVRMHTLNRQRTNLLFSQLLDTTCKDRKPMTPQEVSEEERIFETDGALRWRNGRMLASAKIGVSLDSLASLLGSRNSATASTKMGTVDADNILNVFSQESYVLWYAPSQRKAVIVLKEDASSTSQLKAWVHALLMAQLMQREGGTYSTNEVLETLAHSLQTLSKDWESHCRDLSDAGWDIDAANLETMSGTRLRTGKVLMSTSS